MPRGHGLQGEVIFISRKLTLIVNFSEDISWFQVLVSQRFQLSVSFDDNFTAYNLNLTKYFK